MSRANNDAYSAACKAAPIEQGLSSLASFDEVLTAQAYCNLRSALQGHDFDDAFQVAEDAALEKEGA